MNRQQRRAGAKSGAAVARLELGIAHFKAGRTGDAEACFRQVLEEIPTHPDALHLLGYVALATQRHSTGVELIRQAIRHNPNNPEYHAHLAAGYSDLGQLPEALESYTSALKLRKNFPAALCNRANVFARLNRLEEAFADYERAISFKPDYLDAVSSAGMILHKLGRYAEAEAKFLDALRLQPQHPLTLILRGALMRELKRFDEAVSDLTAALALKGDVPEALHERGLAFFSIGKFAEAISDFEAAVSLKPDFAAAYSDLGGALFKTRQLEKANANLRKALEISPRDSTALNNLSMTLLDLKRPEEALQLIGEAISIAPEMPELLNTKGCALMALNRFDEALEYLDRAVAIDPGFAEAHSARGACFDAMDSSAKALLNYERALALDPDLAEAHWNLAINRLRFGDLTTGWIESEWRWKCRSLNLRTRRYDKPLWLGAEPIAGKVVLLHNEQGLGDALQFCRYVPMLKHRGAEVVLEIDSPLRELFSGLPGVSLCVDKGAQLPYFDFHCPLTSLPLAFSTTLDTIPSQVPYLPPMSAAAGPQLGPGKLPRIGLVWSGNPDHSNDHNRSLPFKALLPLLDGVEAQFVSLQKNARAEDEQMLRQRRDVLDLGPELRDFCTTAAVVQQLDLVISVDTSVVHLAGGLGRPLWVLLPYVADWRWLLERCDSPWYPTARLFRQTATRDWASVVERVRGALIDRIARAAE